ncbi:MAG: peptide chain release factor 1 [Acidobacteriota bacterium]
MFDKLAAIEQSYIELERQLSEPEVVSDQSRFQKLARQHSNMQPVVDKFREYQRIEQKLMEARGLMRDSDPEMKALAEEEATELERTRDRCTLELKRLLIPRDPNDEKNVLLEIRAGTGGDEAALFVQEIFRMYSKYAEARRWKIEVISSNPTGIGGFKEIISMVEGAGVYSRLKYESGVHRVQRVPVTEASGRIHTSAVTVAVLPEADEVEVQIDPKDLRVDTFCSSGPGGQSVNTTYSAVRITHIPSNMVVTCQDERSWQKNKAKALRVLRSRLHEQAVAEQQASIADSRRKQVGTGDRSEKIRTYNFPQGRVTDHRIGLTSHRIQEVLAGSLDEFVDALATHFEAEKLKSGAAFSVDAIAGR